MIKEFLLPDWARRPSRTLILRAELPLIACMMWGRLKFHPSASLRALNKRCAWSGMTTAACKSNLLPLSLKQHSRTMSLASGGSSQRWSVVKVMKIGRLSFWMCGRRRRLSYFDCINLRPFGPLDRVEDPVPHGQIRFKRPVSFPATHSPSADSPGPLMLSSPGQRKSP